MKGTITHTSSLEGEITSVTFAGTCKPCSTVTMSGTPYPVKVIHDETGEHLFLLIATGKIRAKFTGCPLGVTCTFETGEVHLDANNRPGSTPLILTLKNELKLVEGSAFACGSVGKWDANYVVTHPTPSFLALDKKEEA